MMSQNRSIAGKFGAPSYIRLGTRFGRIPYTTYECPVTHPMSAVHQSTCPTSGIRLKVSRAVMVVKTMYPPVVCRIPLGLPVEPEVYRRNSMRSEEHTSELQS